MAAVRCWVVVVGICVRVVVWVFWRTAEERLLLSLRFTTTTRELLFAFPLTVLPLKTVRVLPAALTRLFELATLVRVFTLVRAALVRIAFSVRDEKLLRVPLAAATALERPTVPPA